METVCFSETLASADEFTRRQNPEEHHQDKTRLNNVTLETGSNDENVNYSVEEACVLLRDAQKNNIGY
jgi:hypothetical protein